MLKLQFELSFNIVSSDEVTTKHVNLTKKASKSNDVIVQSFRVSRAPSVGPYYSCYHWIREFKYITSASA